jgi:hypothetical protein
MQSFRHSRGRILFEVFCALAIAASCAGAWMQTGATALLPAAAVAALYGLVHAFDMRRQASTVAAAPRPIDLARIPEPVVPASQPILVPPAPTVEQQLTTDSSGGEGEKAELEAARPSRPRRAKAAPKGGRRRASAREEDKPTEVAGIEGAKASESAPSEGVKASEPAPSEEAKVTEPLAIDEPKVTDPTPSQAEAPRRDETSPVPLRPLFEPEPFVRQQRAAFGRKS